ncbi:MAG: hypothetical protein V3W41_01780 [Planctomycetota bacterium]
MKKAIWIFGIAMVLGGGAFWWVQGIRDDDTIVDAESLDGRADPVTAEARREHESLKPSIMRSQELPKSSGESPMEERREAFVPELLVVDLDDQPVAGAALSVRAWQRRLSQDAVGVESAKAQTVFGADENGIAKFEGLKPGRHQLIADHEGRLGFGAVWVPKPGQDVSRLRSALAEGRRPKIVLSEYKKRVIEIVDSKGKGVSDAIVVVIDPDSEEMPASFQSEFNGGELVSFITDSSGRIEMYTKPRREHGLHRAKKLRVIVQRYGAEPPERTFDLGQFGETLRVEIPDTVAVTFQARSAAGKAFERGARLFWTAGDNNPLGHFGHISFNDEARKSDNPEDYYWNWSLPIPPGGRRIRAFAPSSTITTCLRYPGYMGHRALHQLNADPEQSMVLTTGSAKARLQLRLVDEVDEAFAFSNFTFELTSPEGRVTYLYFSGSDKSGTAETEVDPLFEGQLHLIPEKVEFRRGQSQAKSAFASFEIRGLRPGEVLDLGVVTCERQPLLISGIVQDQSGQPLPKVSLHVRSQAADGGFGFVDNLSSESDDEGRFKIRGEAKQDSKYEISAYGQWSCEPVKFSPGARGFVLTLTQLGKVEGRVRATDPKIDQHLKLVYERRESRDFASSIFRKEGGRFLEGNLLPGLYDFTVYVAGIELRRFEGIEIEAEKTAKPPELQDLVIGDEMALGRVTVLDPDGNPVPDGSVVAEGETKRSAFGMGGETTDKSGEVTLMLKKGESFSIKVSTSGRHGSEGRSLQPQTLKNPTFPLEIRIEYMPAVTLRLSRTLPDIESGEWTLMLSRLRSPDELRAMRERWQRLAAKLKNLSIPARKIPTRVFGHRARLATAKKIATIEVADVGPWEVLVLAPWRLALDRNGFVVIAKLDILLKKENEVFDLEVSDAMIEKIEALIAH